MEEPEWNIYALLDPSGRVRYVGKAASPSRRLQQHISAARVSESLLGAWLRSFGSGAPGLAVLESGNGPGWQDAEKRWIAEFRRDGCDLLNIGDGGHGRSHRNYPREGVERLPRYRPPEKIDLQKAQRMLDEGESVIEVALRFRVSPSAVYKRIHEGKLTRRSDQ